MKKNLLLLALFLLVQVYISDPADGYEDDGKGWQIRQLDLVVTVLPDEAHVLVEGLMEVELDQKTSKGPTIALNARVANMEFTRVEVEGADSIEINKRIPEKDAPRVANIRFATPFSRGARLKISFAYQSQGGSSQFGVSDRSAIASWVDAWHPVPWFDTKKASLSSQAKSKGTITLRLPTDWRGVCEGKLVSREKQDGKVVERWRCDRPVARSFAAGKFSVAEQKVNERTLRVYRLTHTGVSAERLAHTIANVLRSLEKRYGPYPYDSYAIIEVPPGLGSFGAASLQGMILARSHWFKFENGSLPLFSHEMAHGWWGNLVGTGGPGSILCSESLAQYSAALAIESELGPEKATEFMRFSRDDYIANQCARGYFQLWRDGHDTPMSKLGSGGWFHTLSDSKGHWVFHMLRRRVGDEVFFSTLRTLLKKFANQRMALGDVRSAFIKAAPNAELDQFFKQWLDQKGAPVLSVDWQPKGKSKVNVSVVQEQPGPAYHLRLDLGLLDNDKEMSVRTVNVRKKKQTFELAVNEIPTKVQADPNHRLLIWTPAYGPNPLEQDQSAKSTLTVAQLKAYVGEYEVAGAGTVRFFLSDDKMMSQLIPDGNPEAVEHIGDQQFLTNGLTVTFTVTDGRAIKFVAERDGKKRYGERKK